ncbi:MAG TPA: tripartite tricarboxylate transporter permease, partial [Burkholderiales bacterium]|nr:tripartite tricarboxylate transporter permease [Burkholderiales bacterium]
SQQPTLAYGIFAAYILAHFLMIAIMLLGVRWFLKVVAVPKSILFPIILVLCTVGAFALDNTMANVYVLLLFGLVGYAMVKAGLPLEPLILGVILGDQIEINLVRAIMTDDNPWLFLTRPISGVLLLLSVLSVAFALWQHHRMPKKELAAEDVADF